MKNIYFALLIVLLNGYGYTAFSQEKIKPSFTQSVKIKNTKEGKFAAGYVFKHNNDLYVLANKQNLRVYYYIYFIYAKPFTSGMFLYKIDKNRRANTAKPEKIEIPMNGQFYQYENAWYKDGVVNIYTSYVNPLKGKKFYFCTQFDLNTKVSKTVKIMETKKRENPSLELSKNEKHLLVISDKKKDDHTQIIHYGILNHENEWEENGENIEYKTKNNITYSSYTLSDKGNVIIATKEKLPKKSLLKKKQYIEQLTALKNNQLIPIDMNDTGNFVSGKQVFVDQQGNLKLCNLFGEDEKKSIGISIADINEKDFRISNQSNYLFRETANAKPSIWKNGTSQIISKVSTTPSGATVILTENYYMRVKTTTSTSKSGTTTSTSFHYDYGPGAAYTFDNQYNHLSTTHFNYKASYTNTDLGSGLDMIGYDKFIYLFSDKSFYKFANTDLTYQGKAKFTAKSSLKSFVGKFATYVLDGNNAYVLEVINSKEFKVSEYLLNP